MMVQLPLRLGYSSLHNNFWVGRAQQKENKDGKQYLVYRGKKTEVTADFYDCLVNWMKDRSTLRNNEIYEKKLEFNGKTFRFAMMEEEK